MTVDGRPEVTVRWAPEAFGFLLDAEVTVGGTGTPGIWSFTGWHELETLFASAECRRSGGNDARTVLFDAEDNSVRLIDAIGGELSVTQPTYDAILQALARALVAHVPAEDREQIPLDWEQISRRAG